MPTTLTVTLPSGDLAKRITDLEIQVATLQTHIAGLLPISVVSFGYITISQDPTNVLGFITVSMPLADAQQLSTVAFSYDPSKVYSITSVGAYPFDNSLTQIEFYYDSTGYDLSDYSSSVQSSTIITT